jgi:hypothetical protein
MIDVDGDVLRPSELDGEHLDLRDARLDGLGDLAVELAFLVVNLGHLSSFSRKKWAPGAPTSPSWKCGCRQDSKPFRAARDQQRAPPRP